MAVSAGEDVVGDLLFVGGILFAVWGAATIVRSRQELAGALAVRTVELEHEEREENAKLAVTEERARIARELHDVVAHNLSIMVLQAGAERRAIGDERPQTTEALATIEDTGRTAMAEMRRLLGMLRRSDDELALAPQPSLRYLDDLVGQVRDAGLPVDLRIEGEPRAVAPGVDLSAYRIIQEALTNALAGPASARVTVRYGDNELDIEIADDGTGATTPAPAGGHGLVGMRERVALFGGDLAAGRRLSGGYVVRAKLRSERHDVIRVLLADDQALVRGGLRKLVDHEDDMTVVAEAADGRTRSTPRGQPARRRRDGHPHAAARRHRGHPPHRRRARRRRPRAHADDLRARQLRLPGAARGRQRLHAQGRAAGGAGQRDPRRRGRRGAALAEVTRSVIGAFARRPQAADPTGSPRLDELTDREREVLLLLTRGRSNAEIAADLVVSDATVKTHVAHVLMKLGVRDRVQAVIFAYEAGLVSPGDAGS